MAFKCCATCQHYKRVDDKYGKCFRYPPFPVWEYNRTVSQFSKVKWHETCGEYKENEKNTSQVRSQAHS